MRRPTNKEQTKERLAINKPPIVSQQEWEAARHQLLVKEKALTRSRECAGRRTPTDAVDGGGEELRVRRAEREGKPARLVRGSQAVNRLSRLLRARGVRLARARLPRLLAGRGPGHQLGPCERPRHYPCLRLTRAAGRHRAPEGADGLGDALVHHNRQLRRGLRRQ